MKGYLHVVIALSYIGTQFRKKVRMFPYSISYRATDRFCIAADTIENNILVFNDVK
jgi:hypothetical protein